MSLSSKIKRAIIVALASKEAGEAVATAATPLPHIAPIGATTNLRTDTTANLGADAEARLDALEGKVDTLLTALTTAGKMDKA